MSICAARKHDSGVFLINGAAGKRLGRLPLPSVAAQISGSSRCAKRRSILERYLEAGGFFQRKVQESFG
jgi:hypothetical protein